MFSKLKSSNLNSFLIQIIPLCIVFCAAAGFKQELWLYHEDGNALHFQDHVPDTSIYYPVLQRVYKYCARGKWFGYSEVNYGHNVVSLGLAFTPDLICSNLTEHIPDAKSFRYWGANNTSVAAISLYSQDFYSGGEILVTGRAHAGIDVEIKSIAATGTTNWRLFEGPHLDGKSICYKVPATQGYFFNFDRIYNIKEINGIKSVFRGCNLEDVKNYKKPLLSE